MTDPTSPTRRDVVHLATMGTAAVGLGGVVYMLGRSTGPSTNGRESPLDIDVTTIDEGSQLKLIVGQKPVFIRHRTAAEIVAAQAEDSADLPDPETDRSRLRSRPSGELDPRFLVLVGTCSHFGCVPVGTSGDYDGWYCPCHGSHFDTSGRVRKGPAPRNMEIPDYAWIDDTTIRFESRWRDLSEAEVKRLRCPPDDHA